MRWLEYNSDDGYDYCEAKCFYAVAVGRRTGIFSRHEEASEQVLGFPGFCMRKFSDYEDARDFLEEFEIYCESLTSEEAEEEFQQEEEEEQDCYFYAVAVGRATGVFFDAEDARDQVFGFPGARINAFLGYEEAAKYVENTQFLIKEEKRKKEEEKRKEEEEKSPVWFYAVAVGRSTGVFMNYQDAVGQVRGYSGFQMKKFADFEEAQEYIAFNQVYSSDDESEEEEETWYYAVAVGRCVGIYTNHEAAVEQVRGYSGFRMKKFEEYADAKSYMQSNQVEFKQDEASDEEEEPEETWYYAVAVGRAVGIYTHHENAVAQVHGYPGFKMRKFHDLEDAQAYIRSFQLCYSEEEEKSEEPEPVEECTTWFYAVAVGCCVGIYTSYEEAVQQVHGFSGCRMKKFEDYDEAEEYLDFNRAYSSDGYGSSSGYEDETEPEEEEETWHYAVAVGRHIGVYTDLEVAKAQVDGYSGFRMKKFLDYYEAEAYVEGNKYVSEDERETDEVLQEDEEEQWYYAVAVGRHTGIYTGHEDAVDQVYGFSGFRMKKFLDYNEAQAYLKNNRAYSSNNTRAYRVEYGGWS